jgi:hypothetical protein
MYTNDMAAIRRNWVAAHTKRPKSRVRVKSTCYPDTTDFNEAAQHQRKELLKLTM